MYAVEDQTRSVNQLTFFSDAVIAYDVEWYDDGGIFSKLSRHCLVGLKHEGFRPRSGNQCLILGTAEEKGSHG
jgi:hypothetical protein